MGGGGGGRQLVSDSDGRYTWIKGRSVALGGAR